MAMPTGSSSAWPDEGVARLTSALDSSSTESKATVCWSIKCSFGWVDGSSVASKRGRKMLHKNSSKVESMPLEAYMPYRRGIWMTHLRVG